MSVYLDDSAPNDLQAHVRQAFASASPHARVSLTYLDGRPFAPFEGDDMSVIVAGLNEKVGAYAEELRAAGVPVMVVTTLPSIVFELAAQQGHPIPSGDVAAPKPPVPVLPADRRGADAAERPVEPFVLDDEAVASLDERMGGWVIETCREKRLAFALAFPFARKPLSLEAVNTTALQNAGVGLLVIIPGADLPVMTLNQAKMLLMVAAAYGEELQPGAREGARGACGRSIRLPCGCAPDRGVRARPRLGGEGGYRLCGHRCDGPCGHPVLRGRRDAVHARSGGGRSARQGGAGRCGPRGLHGSRDRREGCCRRTRACVRGGGKRSVRGCEADLVRQGALSVFGRSGVATSKDGTHD